MNFNTKNQTVFAKTVEPKKTLKHYYGISTENQVLDYEANMPIVAKSHFEMEFAAMGTELAVMNVYK